MTTNEASLGDVEFARYLAGVAAEMGLDLLRRGLVVESKPDGSPVSNADVAIERRLLELLAAQRPADAVLGEELGARGEGRRRWIIDPIDGTMNFVAGKPEWGNHIALEYDGRIVIGVITRPVLGQLCWASRGRGAYRVYTAAPGAEVRLRVSDTQQLEGSRITLWAHAGDPLAERLRQKASWVQSDLNGILLLAAGEFDAVIDRTGKPWDHAPAVVIVEEAGGRFSDPQGGQRLDLGEGRYSNGLLHASLEQLLDG